MDVKLDIRRVIIIFVIAVLFTILVNVSIDAFYPAPGYGDYCEEISRPSPFPADGGQPELVENLEKERACMEAFESAHQRYTYAVFMFSAVSGLFALAAGLYLPQHKNPVNEWVGSGFLLGGLVTVFIGTIRSFSELGRFTRPLVILMELVLVLYLAYRKLGKPAKAKHRI